uniref:DNA repair protein RAD50 n=1 Tax=Panagrolaimus davidi TaxID=227884 RepID=A0A914QLH4_9BILA
MELQEQFEGLAGIEKALRDFNNKYSITNNQKQTILGHQAPLKDSIKKAQRQLLESNIQNAVENYRDKYSEKCLNEEMSKDLEIYTKCLDDAIISFHSLKMERINIILQELWSTVYDGNDIEAIRIKSDPVGGSDKRKSYNYSVVMIVDGKELEMRDRCSAGQKVLASILIRIALAEVFAASCPILALDEPTTNLDVDKIDNIGHMLTRLIESRGDHIQLVVITHDKQLVSLLHLSCRPEYVYGLSKNEYSVSKLKRHTRIGDTQDVY